jgi:hypothetical protein
MLCCTGCGLRGPEMMGPMLDDGLWWDIADNPKEDIWCATCIEKAMGRELHLLDLKLCGLTVARSPEFFSDMAIEQVETLMRERKSPLYRSQYD